MEVRFTVPGMLFFGFVFIVIFFVAWFIIAVNDSNRIDNINRQLRRLARSYSGSESEHKALEKQRERIGRFAWLRCIPFFLVGVGVLQAASYGITYSRNVTPAGVTPAQAAEINFGMQHGGTFPLMIGDRIDGSTANVSSNSGLFSHSLEMQSNLDTGFAVDYIYDGSHYPLVIPSSKTEYITTGVEPGSETITMELEINHQSGMGNVSDRLGTLHPSCENVLWNLLLTCLPDGETPRYENGPNTLAEALRGDGIWHVTVRMTQENYDQLFGFSRN